MSLAQELTHRIRLAHQARGAVRALSIDERLRLIRMTGERVRACGDELVRLMIDEGEYVRKWAAWQLEQVVHIAEAFDVLIDLIRPRKLAGSERDWLWFEPYGVVGIVSPSNAPLMIPFYTLACALGGGNAAVLRPSGAAPATAHRVFELFRELWPAGAVQFTTCPAAETATELVENPDVHAILIYAGSAVGKDYLARLGRHYDANRSTTAGAMQVGGRLKKFVPELAGNDPLLALPGADLDLAANGAVVGAFVNAGQTCASAKRILVHREVAGPFIERFIERISRLKVGDPRDPDTDIGPIGKPASLQLAAHQLEDAVARGGHVLAGGSCEGRYFHPTLVSFEASQILGRPFAQQPLLWTEECFAPLRSLVVFDSDDDAVALASDTPYGLGASLFGSEDRCLAIARHLDVGRVIINEDPLCDAIRLPFGGVKDSGLYGATHKIEELTYAKLVHLGA
jgi:acyl-CoA reductase-like NAD-dependent aldehyde dehydrogenase